MSTNSRKKRENPLTAGRRKFSSAGIAQVTAAAAGVPVGARSELPLSQIRPNPDQPRRTFDEEFIGQLTESIRARGVLVPIRVRVEGDHYIIVNGEQRYRASQLAGKDSIPVIVDTQVDYTDYDLAVDALTENMVRQDLNVVDELEAIYQLVRQRSEEKLGGQAVANFDYQELEKALNRMRNNPDEEFTGVEAVIVEVAETFGISWKQLAKNKANIWRWPSEIVEALRTRTISLGVARQLQRISDEEERAYWLHKSIEEELSEAALREQLQKQVEQKRPRVTERVPALRSRFLDVLDQLTVMGDGEVPASVNNRLDQAEKLLDNLERLLKSKR